MRRLSRCGAAVLALGALVGLSAGCGGASAHAAAAPVTLTLWSHGGTAQERAALESNVAGFEHAHPGTTVSVRVLSEGDYTTHLQAGVSARALPDVVDVDGPLVASFAAQGAFAPLEPLVGRSVVAGMLPTLRTQGTYAGHLWALGTFDSGLGLWADRAALRRAGVRLPEGARGWTAAQFRRVLAALAAHDRDGEVLDLKTDYGTGEWLTYGFGPLLASAGGSLSRLDSPADVRALTELASWRRWVDPDTDGKAFTARRAALSWVGHWAYADYRAALGQDLVLLPLPDLGHGSRTGSGSWAWAVARQSTHQAAAGQLLRWLDSDEAVLRTTAGNGAIPGTRSALAASTAHQAGGPLHLYLQQRQAGEAVPRPVTPDYPVLTAAFSSAVAAVLDGAAPGPALRAAARQARQP